MRYKVGDEVVLRDDIKVGNSYGDVYVSEELQSAIGGSVEILEKGSGFPKRYYVANGNSINSISETMIDHEETSVLFQRNLVERLKDEACLLKEPAPPLQPSIKALGELHIKNSREIDWKLNDVEQWETEIVSAYDFVDSLEERNASIEYAITLLTEGAGD